MKYVLIPSATADIEVSDEERFFPRDWDIIAGEWLISHDILMDVIPGTGNCPVCSRFGRTGGWCPTCERDMLPVMTERDMGLCCQPMQFNPVLMQELFADPNLPMEWMRPTEYALGTGLIPITRVESVTQNIRPEKLVFKKTMDIN